MRHTQVRTPRRFFRPYSYLGITLTGLLVTFCGQNNAGTAIKTQNQTTAVLSITGFPDYGTQLLNSITEKTFTVTNSGKVAATEVTGNFYLSVAFGYKDGAFPGTGGTCGTQVEVGESCTIVVLFTPKYIGATQSTLSISYFNGVQQSNTTDPTLKGSGV